MDVLMLALNSKYIHTNLAVRYLKEYSRQRGMENVDFVEYTINHRLPQVVDEIYRRRPAVLLLSCYIWNIEMMKGFAREYKKICPKTVIIAGGPEVSYNSRQVLLENRAIDMVMAGEGEKPLYQLLEYFAGRRALEEVASLTYWKLGEVVSTPWEEEIDLAQLPFAYTDIEQLKNKILYFETIRGCPFRCSYCLSSIIKNVRYMPLEQVFRYLQVFLDHRVQQVKFVDRTFNCSKEHAMAIWKYLAQHDNGITNFHFELTAHLMDEEMLSFLKTVRQGLFQFEIGVQSTNAQTIEEIRRTTSTEKLLEVCRRIDKEKNIHLHLDLIAGLPWEGLESFGHSFDQVMDIWPQQMQMGFLKILKGSLMEKNAGQYGMVYSEKAPYQVYTTKWLDYDEMLLLKDMEEMVETYYNSGRFGEEIRFILAGEPSIFRFFLEMGRSYVAQGLHLQKQSPEERHTLLKDFYLTRRQENQDSLPFLKELCLYDICLHEKPKKLPDWVELRGNIPYREQISRFYETPELVRQYLPEYEGEDPKRILKMAHLQIFQFNVLERGAGPRKPEKRALLFNYLARDLLGNARVWDVTSYFTF